MNELSEYIQKVLFLKNYTKCKSYWKPLRTFKCILKKLILKRKTCECSMIRK